MYLKPLISLLILGMFCGCATKPQSRSKKESSPETPLTQPVPVKSWYLTDSNLTRCYEGTFNYGEKLKAQEAGRKIVEKDGACSTSYLKKKELSTCVNLQAPKPKSLVKVVFYEVKEIPVGKDEKVLTPGKVCDELHGELN